MRWDVAILGAGAAGLTAARRLSEAGLSVLVLEARERVGGRIWTVRDAMLHTPIELGAEFIHGLPRPTWDVVREAGLTAYDVPFEHLERRGSGLVTSTAYTTGLQEVMKGLRRLERDVSFAEYLRGRGGVSARARRAAKDFVEGFDAADPQLVSSASLAEEYQGLGNVEEEPQFRLLEGYGAVMEYLYSNLAGRRAVLKTGTVVREVRWKKGEVDIGYHTRRAEHWFQARRVIVTLPLGVLQARSVRFTPELPGKDAAMEYLASGHVVKAVVLLHDAPWVGAVTGGVSRLANAGFVHVDGNCPTWWTPRPLRTPLITGWAGGPKARELAEMTPPARRAQIVGSLARVLGLSTRRAAAKVAKVFLHDWTHDPYALGAYSYVRVGGMNSRAKLAKPVAGTLFFAGEATDTSGQASTVAGAIASGLRAAREVLRSRRST